MIVLSSPDSDWPAHGGREAGQALGREDQTQHRQEPWRRQAWGGCQPHVQEMGQLLYAGQLNKMFYLLFTWTVINFSNFETFIALTRIFLAQLCILVNEVNIETLIYCIANPVYVNPFVRLPTYDTTLQKLPTNPCVQNRLLNAWGRVRPPVSCSRSTTCPTRARPTGWTSSTPSSGTLRNLRPPGPRRLGRSTW